MGKKKETALGRAIRYNHERTEALDLLEAMVSAIKDGVSLTEGHLSVAEASALLVKTGRYREGQANPYRSHNQILEDKRNHPHPR